MDTALQSSVYVSSPEFAGWLVKRGFHWRKLWKRRWVALHGAEIVYMEKEPTLENSATMNITKAQITTATVIDREDIDGNANGFAIHVNDGQTPTWYLRAESAREKKSWLMRLAHVHAIVKWLEDFEKVKVLGVGGTGIVYELLHKTNGQRFAMKEMEIKNKAQMQMAVSEAEMLKDIMENVSHPNIMHIEKVFQVGSKFYLVFPLCMGGELYEHIIRRGHFTEHDAAVIIRDLISGLQALHQHDILHLDIKPENILFDTMEEDAKIRITDFGLSKMYSLVQGAQEKSKEQFTPEMMAEKLKAFQESGELNRERLRGTVGYMSPELILTGHCSKATDVFAAGVVLYILLCGRPPFNSKSNREVLEKTAKGTYKLTGAEWEDVSAEAKDLVRLMLKTNPLERIATEDILEHPWIKQLEAEEAEEALQKSRSGSDSTSGGGGGAAVARTGTMGSTGGRKNTNLAGALRMLSGHVRHLRSEKLATSMTRIVSMMQGNGPESGGGSTLANMYLVPNKKGHNKESLKKIAETEGSGDAAAAAAAAKAKAEEDDDEAAATAVTTDVELLFMNGDVREAVTEAIYNVVDNDEGKLTLEQFLVIAKHFHTSLAAAGGGGAASGGASAGIGIVHLLLCRFVDRDGDGFISVDDLFAAQALIIQRSEVFIRLLFRLFTESIWYPGRQLNLQNLLSHTNLKSTADSSSSNNSGDNNSMDSKNNSNSGAGGGSGSSGGVVAVATGTDLRRNSSNSIKVLDSKAGSGGLLDVVEPPKFITARHVTAVFEKLGYEGEGGQKAFNTLCEALARLKAGGGGRGPGTEGDRGSDAASTGPAAAAASPLPKGNSSNNISGAGAAGASPLGKAPSGRNSALAAALDEDFEDDDSDDGEDEEEEDEWGMGGGGLSSKQGAGSSSSANKSPKRNKPKQQQTVAATVPGDRGSLSNSSNVATPASNSNNNNSTTRESASGGGLVSDAFHSPLYSSAAATARTRASSGVWQAPPSEAVMAAAGGGAGTPPPPSPGGSSANPTPNPPSAAAAAGAANMKMDINDFIRAIELDDIFLQAVFRRPRHKMVKLMQKVDERSKLEAKVREQHYKLAQEDPAAAAAMLKAAEDKAAVQLSRGRSRTQSVASMETQSVFEEELRTAFANVSLSEGVARPKFPVLAAVGRLGLGAAFGFAGKLAKATGAVVEATLETLEGGDEDPDSDDSGGEDSSSDAEDDDSD